MLARVISVQVRTLHSEAACLQRERQLRRPVGRRREDVLYVTWHYFSFPWKCHVLLCHETMSFTFMSNDNLMIAAANVDDVSKQWHQHRRVLEVGFGAMTVSASSMRSSATRIRTVPMDRTSHHTAVCRTSLHYNALQWGSRRRTSLFHNYIRFILHSGIVFEQVCITLQKNVDLDWLRR